MKTTLTELARHTSDIVRPVIDGGKTVIITVHGKDRAKIVPIPKVDRKAALKLLMSMGPLEMPPR
jgi:prevent-host-death family protein